MPCLGIDQFLFLTLECSSQCAARVHVLVVAGHLKWKSRILSRDWVLHRTARHWEKPHPSESIWQHQTLPDWQARLFQECTFLLEKIWMTMSYACSGWIIEGSMQINEMWMDESCMTQPLCLLGVCLGSAASHKKCLGRFWALHFHSWLQVFNDWCMRNKELGFSSLVVVPWGSHIPLPLSLSSSNMDSCDVQMIFWFG